MPLLLLLRMTQMTENVENVILKANAIVAQKK